MEQQLEKLTPKQLVAKLIFGILAKNITTRNALLMFPNDKNSSIQTAWHALVHYEADEEIRWKDKEYADEQDDYLEMIAFILEKNEDLPKNIIESYDKYYKEAPLPQKQNWKGILKGLFRFIT
jgi:hypothetical protein